MASLWHFSTTRSIFLHKVRHKQILATNHRLVHCTTTSASELTQSSATLRSHDKQGCPLVCTQKLTSNAFLVLSDSRSSLLSILKFIALAKSVAPLPTSILAEAFSSTHLATDIGFGYLHVSYTGQMSYLSVCLHSLNRPFQSSDSTKATVTASHHCCVKLDQAFAVWIASSPNVVRASTWVIFNIIDSLLDCIYTASAISQLFCSNLNSLQAKAPRGNASHSHVIIARRFTYVVWLATPFALPFTWLTI